MARDNPDRMIGVSDVATRLAVKPQTVLAWIRGGELAAVNVARANGGRPRWRIRESDLDAFLAARQPQPAAGRPRRTRRVTTGVIQFF